MADLLMTAFTCAHIELISENQPTEQGLEKAEAYAREAFIKFCEVVGIEEVDEPKEN
jgi:hypothetical protein